MSFRTGSTGISGTGMLAPVISLATGLLVFVMLVVFAPVIASTLYDAQPDYGTTCSYVNATEGATHTGRCGTANATDANSTYRTAVSQDAMWNPDYNNSIPSGVSTWITNIQIVGIIVLVMSIGLAMYFLKTAM